MTNITQFKTSQDKLILAHLRKTSGITVREAMVEYSVNSLTKQISGGYDQRCLEVIWDALHEWQDIHEGRNPVGKETYEERWDNICTAMAWIKEDLEDIHYVGTYVSTTTEKETV